MVRGREQQQRQRDTRGRRLGLWLGIAAAAAAPAHAAAPLCTDPSLPGWTAAGPERGHVMGAAVGTREAAVTTRAGVLTAPADLSRWRRDPRFPPQTRVLAYGPDDRVWASTPGHLWHIDDSARIVALWERSLAVSLAPDGPDTVYAAVRGEQAGLYRVQGTQVTRILDGVDPWQVLVRDGAIWLATLDQGIWHAARADAPLTRLRDDTATALGWVAGAPLAATQAGTLLDLRTGETVARMSGGWASAIAETDGLPLLVLAAAGIAVVREGVLQPVSFSGVDRDGGPMHMTGAWSLPDGSGVLLGTFRRGPLRYAGGQVTAARTDFRGTVTGGISGSPAGEILFAAMGTGVYLSADGQTWTAQHGHTGPVTDAVGVAWTGTGFAVADFEGLALRDTGGNWSRMTGTKVDGVPRRSGLVDVSRDAEGRWWALDDQGGLWLRSGEQWTACTERDGLRLDGWGSDLRLASADGYRTLTSCTAPNPVTDPTPGTASRAAGPWLAAPGSLSRQGRRIAALPEAEVQAIAARSDGSEVLVALEDHGVLRCTASGTCAPVARCLPVETLAVGWLPDGRVWAAEAQGTIQLAGGEQVPTPWSQAPPTQARPFPDQALLRAPWNEGQSQNPQSQSQAQHQPPRQPQQQRPPGTPPATAPTSTPAPAPEPAPTTGGCQSLSGPGGAAGLGWLAATVAGLAGRLRPRRSRSCRPRP